MNKQIYEALRTMCNSMWSEFVRTKKMQSRQFKGRYQNFLISQNVNILSAIDIYAFTDTQKVFVGSINLMQGSFQTATILYSMIIQKYLAGITNSECLSMGIYLK